jgi:hypothetical protein
MIKDTFVHGLFGLFKVKNVTFAQQFAGRMVGVSTSLDFCLLSCTIVASLRGSMAYLCTNFVRKYIKFWILAPKWGMALG